MARFTIKDIVYALNVFAIWRKYHKYGYKHFFIFGNEEEFWQNIPEEVYSIFDVTGSFVCDLLESDYLDLYDRNYLINIDCYENQGLTEAEARWYPNKVGNYFLNRNKKDAEVEVKRNQTVIIILDKQQFEL